MWRELALHTVSAFRPRRLLFSLETSSCPLSVLIRSQCENLPGGNHATKALRLCSDDRCYLRWSTHQHLGTNRTKKARHGSAEFSVPLATPSRGTSLPLHLLGACWLALVVIRREATLPKSRSGMARQRHFRAWRILLNLSASQVIRLDLPHCWGHGGCSLL